MTPDRARALLEAATPGPWRASHSERCDGDGPPEWDGGFVLELPVCPGDPHDTYRVVSHIGGEGWGGEEADLMAAAPDLARAYLDTVDGIGRAIGALHVAGVPGWQGDDGLGAGIAALLAERDALRAYVERLREALPERVFHASFCRVWSTEEGIDCDCGAAATEAELAALRAAPPADSLAEHDRATIKHLIVHLLSRADEAARLHDDEQEEQWVRAARGVLIVVTDTLSDTEGVARMESLWDRAEALRAGLDQRIRAEAIRSVAQEIREQDDYTVGETLSRAEASRVAGWLGARAAAVGRGEP